MAILKSLGYDEGEELVEGLVARIRHDPASYPAVSAIIRSSGVGARKLDELCRIHYHVTPALLLTQARVDAARKALLRDDRPIAEIACDVGFASLAAFNLNFRQRAAMSPQQYRNLRQEPRFDLSLPEDYPIERILRYLGRDPLSLTERVEGQTYIGVFRPGATTDGSDPVLVRLDFAAFVARCRILSATALAPEALERLHSRLIALLGLTGNPAPFEAQVAQSSDLASLVENQRGLRVPLIADPFDALIWAIVGQQISLAFAYTLRRRLVARIGVEAGLGLYAPPTPEAVAALEPSDLVALSFSRSKARYLIDAARLVVSGALPLADLTTQSATRIERTLLAVRGLGPWSTHYLLMRSYGFLDCVPLGDAVLGSSLQRFFALGARPTKAETLALMSRFRPYRSLATFHLWQRHGSVA